MKIKKLLTIFLSLFIALSVCLLTTSCSNNKLYIATSPDYAPYEFIDSTKKGQDQYVGADITLAKYIGKKLNKEVYIDAMSFDQTLINVQNGKDELAISGFTYKEERAQNYEMSNSYYDDGDGDQIVIVLKSFYEQGYKTLDSINNSSIKVGAQSDSVQEGLAIEQLKNANIEKYSTITEMVTYLKAKKIDAIAISSKAYEALNDDLIIKLDDDFQSDDTGLYILAKKGNTELISQVNEIINEVVEQNLYSKWLDESVALKEELGDKALEGIVDNDFILVKAWKMFTGYFGEFMKGLGITLALSFLGVLFASLFGIGLCLMNISKNKILNTISKIYIEVIRGIPLLLQLTVIFLLMPRGTSKFLTCVIALVINSAAYQAEIFRSGINAVDKGQMEAARSLGMSYPKAMIKVIIPQAIKNILPSLANEFVVLIKETSLASTFYVGDLMTVKTIITGTSYDALTPYIIIAVIYFILTFSLSKLINYFEKRLSQ